MNFWPDPRRCALLWTALCIGQAMVGPARSAEPVLVGHWPLEVDGRDLSGHQRHGEAIDLNFGPPPDEPGGSRCAHFNGRTSRLRLPPGGELTLGRGNFRIELELQLADSLQGAPGGLLQQYDFQTLRGGYVDLVTSGTTTSGQPNRNQLQFGLRAGPGSPVAVSCGRPGNATLVFALTSTGHGLYAGTCEPGANQAGRVFRWDGSDRWVDCGSPDGANSVAALAEFQGSLYAATSCYRLRGSALEESPNQTPGGAVYRYQPPKIWVPCGRLAGPERVTAVAALLEYRGQLYATSTYSPGLFRYDGETTWTDLGSPGGKRVQALIEFEGDLYAGSYDGADIYRYGPETGWQGVGSLDENTQTYGLAVWRDQLYVGTWPSGRVYRWDQPGHWISCGRLGEEKEVMPLLVHHGQLLAGTLPLAELYRYRGQAAWESLARLDRTPDVTYRRIWSLATHGGMLFAGTLPSGQVWRIEEPGLATCDQPWPTGWHRLAIGRTGERIWAELDGRTVAEARLPAADFDTNCDLPTILGAGLQTGLRGQVRDLRWYRDSD